jgi:hypothetical protein
MSGLLLLALLHEGGWDEVLMVGVGLVLAYVIIMATGRKGAADEETADLSDEDPAVVDEPSDRRA